MRLASTTSVGSTSKRTVMKWTVAIGLKCGTISKLRKESSRYSSHDLRRMSSILQVRSHESEWWSHVLLSAATRPYDSYFAYHRCPSRNGAGFYFDRLYVLYSKGPSSCAIPISNAHGIQLTTTTSQVPLRALKMARGPAPFNGCSSS